MRLKGRVAAVTGAGRNIGEEVALLFSREGAAVAVIDIDRGRAEAVAQQITGEGGHALPFLCDASDPAAVERVVDEIAAAFGGFDILVNNVAYSDNKHILDLGVDEWNRTLAITLTAPFLFAKFAARAMIAAGRGGAIVNVGSTSGYFGRERALAYTAAKGGVANLSRSMAIQLAPSGIRVNSVVPNKIGSPVGKAEFDPTRPVVNLRNRPGVPLDLARAILFLVSDEADFVVGAELFVDGGTSIILPGS